MHVDKTLILKLEKLARLELNEDERSHIQKDLGNILTMVDKLNELPTEGVDPLIYLSETPLGSREDEVKHQVNNQQALRNSPASEGPYFEVPKVINIDK